MSQVTHIFNGALDLRIAREYHLAQCDFCGYEFGCHHVAKLLDIELCYVRALVKRWHLEPQK